MHAIPEHRIVKISGATAYDVGVSLGQHLKSRLAQNITQYLNTRPTPHDQINLNTFQTQALPWLHKLPKRFQDEFYGLADGSNVPIQRIAEWAYIEAYLNQGCSSFLYRTHNQTWIAHNNDTYVPEMWGYATIRNTVGRIPTMSLGLEGDVWTTAGINQAQLWLHMDHLPVSDKPQKSKQTLPTYGFLVEALETCESIKDVASLLNKFDRSDGMLLFATDGKTDTSVVFECSSTQAIQCPFDSNWMVRTNHACMLQDALTQPKDQPFSSWNRFNRLEELLLQCDTDKHNTLKPHTLIQLLADDKVERRDPHFATAYATLSCPTKKEIWFTFGGYPAASKGNWAQVPWPW